MAVVKKNSVFMGFTGIRFGGDLYLKIKLTFCLSFDVSILSFAHTETRKTMIDCNKCKYKNGCPFKGSSVEHKCGIKQIKKDK